MPGPIQSIQRAAAVLYLLGAAGEPMALAEVARSLDLAKPTVHGIVRTLCGTGFVEQDPDTGRYRLSGGFAQIGQAIDPHLMRSRALPWADGLAAQTGLEVQLGVLRGQSVELVHHVFRPDGSPQHLRVGELQPVHATALGLVLLAFAPVSYRLHSMELTAYTSATTTRQETLARAVRTARRQGWADVDGQHLPGVASLAAPLRHHAGATVGALGVVGPRDRLLDAAGRPRSGLAAQVVETAAAISDHLEEKL